MTRISNHCAKDYLRSHGFLVVEFIGYGRKIAVRNPVPMGFVVCYGLDDNINGQIRTLRSFKGKVLWQRKDPVFGRSSKPFCGVFGVN